MKGFLVRRLAYPAKEKILGRRTLSIALQLRKTQWLSREELRERQWKMLQEQITNAYHKTEFYRELFRDAGAAPGDIRGFEDYANLPIVSKAAYAAAGEGLVSMGRSGAVGFSMTSGSTGQPSRIPVSREKGEAALAHALRGREWWGVEIGAREFKFWGRAAAFERTFAGRTRARLKLAKDRLMNVRPVSPFDMSLQALDDLAATFIDDCPDLVFGYGRAILLFAQHLSARGIDVRSSKPKAVIYTSEHLVAAQRDFIAAVFGAPVASEYGAVECGIIGYDAPCGSMHASDESLYLEQTGDPGRLIVTHLGSSAAPLLRYDLGDRVELAPPSVTCACGRGLSVIRSMSGRNNDLVVRPDGQVIHAELFDYVMRQQLGVRRFRIIQSHAAEIEVLLEMNDRRATVYAIADIPQVLRPFTGGDMKVSVREVEHLAPLPSGKFQWVVSTLNRS